MNQSFSLISDQFADNAGGSAADFHRQRRQRRSNRKKNKNRRLKRLLTGSLPYLLVAVSLVLISIGLVRYLEQESVLAIFISRRDAPRAYQFQGEDWSVLPPEIVPTEGETRTVRQPEPDQRITVPFFYIGDQIGVMRIPSVEIEVAVLQGDREAEFRRGAGHYPGSFLPGQGGNILIGAHRTSFFRNFEYLQTGAYIELAATYGRFLYQIDDLFLIDGNDHSIAAATDQEQLTLYTCYPFSYIGNAPQRFVVVASLVESEVYLDE